jgi:hypothetical protein
VGLSYQQAGSLPPIFNFIPCQSNIFSYFFYFFPDGSRAFFTLIPFSGSVGKLLVPWSTPATKPNIQGVNSPEHSWAAPSSSLDPILLLMGYDIIADSVSWELFA